MTCPKIHQVHPRLLCGHWCLCSLRTSIAKEEFIHVLPVLLISSPLPEHSEVWFLNVNFLRPLCFCWPPVFKKDWNWTEIQKMLYYKVIEPGHKWKVFPLNKRTLLTVLTCRVSHTSNKGIEAFSELIRENSTRNGPTACDVWKIQWFKAH